MTQDTNTEREALVARLRRKRIVNAYQTRDENSPASVIDPDCAAAADLLEALTPDHARQVDAPPYAADDWQAKGYTSAAAEIDDMANVGRTLMEVLPEGYSYMDSPAEIVTDLQNELDELRQQHTTPALIEAGEEREAMAAALSLLDTFAGEGLAHVYGNGKTVDATDVCVELCKAFGMDCEPGWWRKVAALSTASLPRSLGTADVRGILIRAGMHEATTGDDTLVPYGVAVRAVAGAIADGFSGGNEQYEDAVPVQQERYDEAARAVLACHPQPSTPVADADRVLVPREPTETMIEAGRAAYGRKADDLWSVTPTEEPDAGGGALGYAYRAMIAAAPEAEGER